MKLPELQLLAEGFNPLDEYRDLLRGWKKSGPLAFSHATGDIKFNKYGHWYLNLKKGGREGSYEGSSATSLKRHLGSPVKNLVDPDDKDLNAKLNRRAT